MRTMVIGGGLLLVACGGGNSAPDATAVDAPAPDAPAPGPNTVTLQVSGRTYLAYRDGNGPWQAMKPLTSGDYAMYITNDYTYVVACSDAGGFDTTMYAHTWSDGAQQFAFCSPPAAAPRAPLANVTVTGDMVQPGSVWMSTSSNGTTSPWTFSLSVPAGTHDVFGVSADHIAIRRALSIPSNTTLPTIDVDQEGSPLDLLPLTINGLGVSDQPHVAFAWFGANDWVNLDGTTTQLIAPPAAMVNTSTDFELAQVDDFLGMTDRGGIEFVNGTPSTSYDLLPTLTGVSFVGTGIITARFGTLPPTYDDVVESLYDSGFTSSQRFDASQSWIAATGATEIGWDSAPPDYDAAWQLLGSAAAFRDFSAYRYVGTILYNTSAFANAPLRRERNLVVEQAGRADPRLARYLERR